MTAPRITIADAVHHAGGTVQIAGWLYNLRKAGKIVFPIVRDGTDALEDLEGGQSCPQPAFRRFFSLLTL